MKGSIVLHQGSNGGRQHFSVVSLPLSMGLVAIHTLGSTDDGGYGDVDTVLSQAIPQGRVIVAGDSRRRSSTNPFSRSNSLSIPPSTAVDSLAGVARL